MAGRRICVVTGGRGFVARNLVVKLVECGRWVVRIVDLGEEIVLSEEEKVLAKALAAGEAQYVRADLRDKKQVVEALREAQVVFHMAAPDSSIPDLALHHAVSVGGTRNVIEACLEVGVKKLIYTSSPSVVCDGHTAVRNGDESLPYPHHHNDAYSETKCQGEVLVLEANGSKGLLTCAIRPSGIFGPGDRLMVPSTVAAARKGKTKFMVGDGENLFDWTYVDNVTHAHLCAERALGAEEGNGVDGKAYFITNGEPMRFWEYMGRILEGLGYEKPRYKVPVGVVIPIAQAAEWACKKLGKSPGQFSVARMRLVSSYRTFNISRAQKLLGYEPVVSLDEGIKRTVESFAHLRKESGSEEKKAISRTHTALGSGKLADVLLWRDAKQTATCLLMLTLLYFYVFIRGENVLRVVAWLSFRALVIVFSYNAMGRHLLVYLLGERLLPRFPSLPVEVGEEGVRKAVGCAGSYWNWLQETLRRAVVERKLCETVRVVVGLLVVQFLGRFSVRGLCGVAILEAFTVPYLCEQYEEELRKVASEGLEVWRNYRQVVVSKLPFMTGLLLPRDKLA